MGLNPLGKLSVGLAVLILAWIAPGLARKALPAEGARNFYYRVWYASQWQVVRFATVQEAVAYRDKITRSPGAGAYEAKLADYYTAPDGSVRPGPGPNPEVYVRQWLNDGSESDPHNAFVKLVALKRHPSKPDTRVQLDYDVPSGPTESLFPWITKSVMLPEIPGELKQTETAASAVNGDWKLGVAGEFEGQWQDGSFGRLRLTYWDDTQAVFSRQDVGGANEGLTARYVGRFVGSSLVGEVAWTWRGNTWQGTWNASPGTWNIAKPQPAAKVCTRGPGVLVQKGSAITVGGSALTYTDPATRATNTIQWSEPPQSVTPGQEMALTSWSTHNQGAAIEVRWETGSWRDYGADSLINEASKQSKIKFNGGRIDLIGGIRNATTGGPGKFLMRWEYKCP